MVPYRILPAHVVVTAVALAASPLLAAPAGSRQSFTLSSGVQVTADAIGRLNLQSPLVASGNVEIKGSQGTLRADRVVVEPQPAAPGGRAPRTAVQEARASGNVRITSQPKPDEKMEATGAAGTYWPGTQMARLTGGVTVTMTSPQLKEPAVLTGGQADINLAQRSAEVTRTQAAQVTLRLQPKEAATGPVRLDADRVHMESATNRVTATGSPVMTSDQGTVRGQKIWFDIDPQANDVKLVHAEGSVRIDSQDPQRGEFHATAQQAVLDKAANEVVLTGDVRGTHKAPDASEPDQLQGEELTYNLKTGGFRLGAAAERRARITVQPTRKPKPGAGTK